MKKSPQFALKAQNRLSLDAFKTQKNTLSAQEKADQLLGQVLGDCHDEPTGSSGGIRASQATLIGGFEQ